MINSGIRCLVGLGSISASVKEEFFDTLTYWLSDAHITDYEIIPSDLHILEELTVTGDASKSQVDDLISMLSEYGYERITRVGKLLKYYNFRLNYGLLIEYPIDDYDCKNNLYIHMYHGDDTLIINPNGYEGDE